ncbi:MAG: hypothetical protein J6A08_04395 [Lachnospiraceae bacterium]|nr:hypothetical protein [Lachnospiraceae bacterium]
MIHSFMDEKNKSHSKQETPSYGLSNEELLELIKQVEAEEMVRAPVHLKANVMARIRTHRQAVKKRQLFTYRAQVLIAMAAALTVLILMPGGGNHIEKIHRSWQNSQEVTDWQEEPLVEKAQKRRQEVDAGEAIYRRRGIDDPRRGILESMNEKWAALEAYFEE